MSTTKRSVSEMFAWQMVQACLQHPSIPQEMGLDGMWAHTTLTNDPETSSHTTIWVTIFGVDYDVRADFSLRRSAKGSIFNTATCRIISSMNIYRNWGFTGRVVSNKLKITLTDIPRPEPSPSCPGLDILARATDQGLDTPELLSHVIACPNCIWWFARDWPDEPAPEILDIVRLQPESPTASLMRQLPSLWAELLKQPAEL